MILFTESFLLSPPTQIPLTNTRILWQDYPKTWTASTEQTNYEAASVENPMTFRRWRATDATSWLKAEMDTADDVNAIGIAAHNLAGKTVTIEHSENDSSWTTLESFVPPDNDSILVLTANLVKPYWRISVSGGIAEIGAVFIGKTLDIITETVAPYTPITFGTVTEKLDSDSESGQFLSRRVIRRGYSAPIAFERLPADWVREVFRPFARYASDGQPFFVGWNPGQYAGEVAYCWTPDDIVLSYSGFLDEMDCSFTLLGFAE